MTTDASITIVSGLPRSGTSMMMQMLARGGLRLLTDGVRAADPDNPRGYYEFEAVKRTKRDRAWLDTAVGGGVKMVHVLLYDLPTDRHYQVILMRREIGEILRSQARMLARTGKAGAALAPERLAQAFQRQMQQVVDYLDHQPCFDVLEVHYDAVVLDPRTQAEAINGFLGNRLDAAAMAAAVEPALYRQRG